MERVYANVRDLNGRILIAVGALPFVVAGALPLADPERLGELGLCPFREVTGLPCPLCGGARAVTLAAHGDGRFVEYNLVWVLVLAAIALAGVALTALGEERRARAGALARSYGTAAAIGVVVLAWAYALVQRGAIVG